MPEWVSLSYIHTRTIHVTHTDELCIEHITKSTSEWVISPCLHFGQSLVQANIDVKDAYRTITFQEPPLHSALQMYLSQPVENARVHPHHRCLLILLDDIHRRPQERRQHRGESGGDDRGAGWRQVEVARTMCIALELLLGKLVCREIESVGEWREQRDTWEPFVERSHTFFAQNRGDGVYDSSVFILVLATALQP